MSREASCVTMTAYQGDGWVRSGTWYLHCLDCHPPADPEEGR